MRIFATFHKVATSIGLGAFAAFVVACAPAGHAAQNAAAVERPSDRAFMSVPQAYKDIKRLQVLCLVQTGGAVASDADRARLCETVVRLAGAGTHTPVSAISLGDPSVVAPGRLTILVHAAVSGTGFNRRVILTMRPYRPAVAGSDVLFGAMPRLAELADDSSLDAAVSASLDEILPWRVRNSGARRID